MSRIGRLPIEIPGSVDVQIGDGVVTVKGPKGELRQAVSRDLSFEREDSRLVVRFVRVGAPGHVVHKRITRAKKGTVALPLNRWMRAGTYRVHVMAFDAGGNASRPIRLFNIHVR